MTAPLTYQIVKSVQERFSQEGQTLPALFPLYAIPLAGQTHRQGRITAEKHPRAQRLRNDTARTLISRCIIFLNPAARLPLTAPRPSSKVFSR